MAPNPIRPARGAYPPGAIGVAVRYGFRWVVIAALLVAAFAVPHFLPSRHSMEVIQAHTRYLTGLSCNILIQWL